MDDEQRRALQVHIMKRVVVVCGCVGVGAILLASGHREGMYPLLFGTALAAVTLARLFVMRKHGLLDNRRNSD